MKARESYRCWRCWWENLTSRRTSSTRRTRRSSPRSSSSSSSWSWLSCSWITSLVLLSRILASLRGFQRYDKKRKYSNWWNKYLLKHTAQFTFLLNQIKTSIFLCQTIVMMNTIVGFWKKFPCLRWLVAPPIFQVTSIIFDSVTHCFSFHKLPYWARTWTF